MSDWLAFSVCALLALWILFAATRALLRRRHQPSGRLERPELPTRQGLRGFARLLAATRTSAYSREQVQARLWLLVMDLASLEGTIDGPGTRQNDTRNEASLNAILGAYFAEDHVGFRGSETRKPTLDPAFFQRTEAVIQHLERRGHNLQGDSP